MANDLLTLRQMLTKQVIKAASGWLELGMPDDALEELDGLTGDERGSKEALGLKLSIQMAKESWQDAAQTAVVLCGLAADEPDYFLSAAFCLHEAGKTEQACKVLRSGPRVLEEFPVYHYNMACYLWTLGEKEEAKTHLGKAVAMDEGFLDFARNDRDLVGMEL